MHAYTCASVKIFFSSHRPISHFHSRNFQLGAKVMSVRGSSPQTAHVLITIMVLIAMATQSQGATKENYYNLTDYLFKGYKKEVRPVYFDFNSTFVFIAFSLFSIVDVSKMILLLLLMLIFLTKKKSYACIQWVLFFYSLLCLLLSVHIAGVSVLMKLTTERKYSENHSNIWTTKIYRNYFWV